MAAAGLLNTNEAVSHGVLLGTQPPAAAVLAPGVSSDADVVGCCGGGSGGGDDGNKL